MYITLNEVQYRCTDFVPKTDSVTFRLSSTPPTDIALQGKIVLMTDDEFELATATVEDWRRYEIVPDPDSTSIIPDEEEGDYPTYIGLRYNPELCRAKLLLTNTPVPEPDPEPEPPSEEELLTEARNTKREQMVTEKSTMISNGVSVITTYGYETFPLSQEDITLLTGIQIMLANGLTEYTYHSTGDEYTNICKVYSADDLSRIIQEVFSHITYHETYCNMLIQWIFRETDISVIEGIYYGINLPDDLATYMYMLLGQTSAETTPDEDYETIEDENPSESGDEDAGDETENPEETPSVDESNNETSTEETPSKESNEDRASEGSSDEDSEEESDESSGQDASGESDAEPEEGNDQSETDTQTFTDYSPDDLDT